MKITTNLDNLTSFKKVPLGDIFTLANSKELYVKVRFYSCDYAVGIRDGLAKNLSNDTPVKVAKHLTVEF